jgi:radical SAM protein with 4Fe4S-binding SPASM domain
MISKSSRALGVILKNINRLAKHPWITSKLLALEGEKWLFNLWHPPNQTGRGGHIRQVSFRITDLCNLRCHTCGQWGDQGFLRGKDLGKLKKNEVPPARYRELLNDLVNSGHKPMIYFWGGEPMLYEGILELIEHATALGLPCSIATNGTRLAVNADRLVRAPLFLMQISIDGHNAALHNQLRPGAGGGDNFADIQAALAAVRQARQAQNRQLPLLASLTVISKYNYRHLVDLYDAFRQQVDLFVFYLSWWIDHERAKAHEQDFSGRFGFFPKLSWGWVGDWKPDDYLELDRQLQSLMARSQDWHAPPIVLIPPIMGRDNLQTYYTDHQATMGFDRCVSIYQAVEVNSNGDLSPCRDYHDYVVGNIKNATISELWNSPAYRDFRRSLASAGLMPVCSRCCGLMGY